MTLLALICETSEFEKTSLFFFYVTEPTECMVTQIIVCYDILNTQWYACFLFEKMKKKKKFNCSILFSINVHIYTNVYCVILLSIHTLYLIHSVLPRRRNRKTSRECFTGNAMSYTYAVCYFDQSVSKQIQFRLNLNKSI